MPYDWQGNEIESKAERHTNMLGIGEIGGVGQLIYHSVRFTDYRYYDSSWGKLRSASMQQKKPSGD